GAAGMADERVGDADEAPGAPRVAEAGGAEVGAADAGVEAGDPLHRAAPGAGSRGAIRSCEPAMITKIRPNLRRQPPGRFRPNHLSSPLRPGTAAPPGSQQIAYSP